MLSQPASLTLDGRCIESVTGVEPPALRAAIADLLDLTRAAAPLREDAPEMVQRYEQARAAVVNTLRAWAKPEKKHALWADVRRAVVQSAANGWLFAAVAPAEPVAFAASSARHWAELAATLLSTPVWRLSGPAPALDDVPDEWWGAYATWLFVAPPAFTAPGEADLYARHHERALLALARWVERNPGSAAVRAAADAYLEVAAPGRLAVSILPLRPAAEARGRILARLLGGKSSDYTPLALPREGRRLRVGVVAVDFAEGAATRRALPLFAQLDPERFEVVLFPLSDRDDALAAHARRRVARAEPLPSALDDRLAALRAAELDVVIFAGDLAARLDDVTRLALHRVAPLQAAVGATASATGLSTTGLPEIDLYLSGAADEDDHAPATYAERLALLPANAHIWDEDAAPAAATQEWTKDSLGLPADAVLYVSAADHRRLTPETWETWARVLAVQPRASLLLQPFVNEDPATATSAGARLVRQCEAVLGRHGVHPDRVLISTLELNNRADVRRLLSVGDIYLDAFPASDATGLTHALLAGLPTITLAGGNARARAGSALLGTLACPELIAPDAAAYEKLALDLAADAERRGDLAARLSAAVARLPLFLDPLGTSDAVGALLETAFDQVASDGLAAFRAERAPLRVGAEIVLDGPGRRARGLDLLYAGQNARAVDYLMAALQQDDGTASLWFDVARALAANGQKSDALQALESALRLDERMVEGWRMLAELAEEVGMGDIAAEARGVITTLSQPSAAAATAPQGLRLKLGGKLGQLRASS